MNVANSIFTNGNSNVKFSSNVASAGGLYVYYGNCECTHYRVCAQHDTDDIDKRRLLITNSTFTNNHGFKGAAIFLESVVDNQDLNGRQELFSFIVLNCMIKNNTGYSGIISTLLSRTFNNSNYTLEMFLSGTTISNNNMMDVTCGTLIQSLPKRSYLSTVGIFELNNCEFRNNTISHNARVGLHIEYCKVDFRGDNIISDNNAFGGFGGGIRLYRAI